MLVNARAPSFQATIRETSSLPSGAASIRILIAEAVLGVSLANSQCNGWRFEDVWLDR
jgi:hypothetical protein